MNIRRTFIFLFVEIVASLSLMSVNARALSQFERESSLILNRADTFFRMMKKRDYKEVWQFLTEHSRAVIITDVCKVIKKKTKKCNLNFIKLSFKEGKGLSRDYWNSYLRYFNPDIVLNQSVWHIYYIHNTDAEIAIKYYKAPKPIFLKMKKENGIWQVGLAETFFNH